MTDRADMSYNIGQMR